MFVKTYLCADKKDIKNETTIFNKKCCLRIWGILYI